MTQHHTRRDFLKFAAQVGAVLAHSAHASQTNTFIHHAAATVLAQPKLRLTDSGGRAPFNWRVAAVPPIGSVEALELGWPGQAAPGAARLRITTMDVTMPRNVIDVTLRSSGRLIGTFDLRAVVNFYVFEIPLSASDANAAVMEGVRLKQSLGQHPVFLFAGGHGGSAAPAPLLPHLLVGAAGSNPRAEYLRRLDSLACVQGFGWREGCVLDGLRDLGALPRHAHLRRSLHEHLALFFKDDGRLVYELQRGIPVNDRIQGIEFTLPFAALAWENPAHPSVDLALSFWSQHRDREGCVLDRTDTTTEGAYTVAYPMAVVARQRKDSALAAAALRQLQLRQERLFVDGHLWRLHRLQPDGSIFMRDRDWSRGVAWQLVGMARTLVTLEGMNDTAAMRDQFIRLAEWAIEFQRPDGTWSVYFDDPSLPADTAGTAGIGAALAIGAAHGILGPKERAAAVRARDRLLQLLTPDGFLTGTSPSNKGGEAVQRSAYRVIFPMSMGLLGQLWAALE
jgi:rhamnogalacturonyl hydrolase YesR